MVAKYKQKIYYEGLISGPVRQKSLNAIIKQCKNALGGFQSGCIRQKLLNRRGPMGRLDCTSFLICGKWQHKILESVFDKKKKKELII